MISNEKYGPDEIPSQVECKLYTYYKISGAYAGCIEVRAFDYEEDNQVLLSVTDCVVQIPTIDRDGLKSKALDMLKAQKAKIQAESFMKLKEVDERIAALLAIEYRSEAA